MLYGNSDMYYTSQHLHRKKIKIEKKFQFVVNAHNHLPNETISVPNKPDGNQLLFLCKLQS